MARRRATSRAPITDGETEQTEHLRLFLLSWPIEGDDREITGTVTDGP